MEHVLAVYQRPRDPKRPLICLDEAAKQLVSETRLPIPMAPGRTARHDYEYRRAGTANIFMAFAPLEGKRHLKVTARRARADYAHFLEDLSDRHFADAEKIVLVQDNLNTHATASLYQRPKKLTLFLPFCVSRQKRFAFRLRRGLRFTPRRFRAILGAATGAAVAALIPADIRVILNDRWYYMQPSRRKKPAALPIASSGFLPQNTTPG